MGRNKIDIKPLEDGRNRTVTFTKRKAGLFKKAHELAILCSVDISVIIIGRNKKIYEYCSNDSNEILNLYQSDQMNMFESKNPKDYGDYESKSRIPPIRNSHGSNIHRPSNSLNEIRERHRLENNHTRTVSDTTQLRNRTRSARGNPIRDVNETIDESQINYDEMEDADHFEDEEGSNDVDDSDGDSNGVEEDLETEDRNLNLGSKRRMPFQPSNHVNKLIKPERRSPLDIRFPPIEPHTPEPSSAQYYNDQTPKLTPYKPLSSLKKAGNSKRPTLSLQIPHNGADDSLSISNQSTITAGNSSNKSNQSVHNKSNEKQGNGTDVDNSKGNNLNISVISNGSENSSNNNNSTTLNKISLKNDENIHTTLPSPKDILSGINIKNQFNMLANNRGRNNLNDGSSTPLTSALRKAFTPTTTNFLNNFNINNSALETPLGGGFNFSTMSPQLTTPAIGFPTLHNHQTDLQQAQTQQQLKQQPASQPQNQLNHLQSQNGLMMGNNQHNSQQQEEQRQQPNQDNRDRSHMVNLTPMNRNSATSTFYPPFPSNLQRGISYMNGIGTSGISNTIGNINSSNNIMNISEPPRVGEMPSKYPDNKTPDTSLFPAEWTMNTGLTPVLQIRPTFPIIRSSGSNMNNIKKATTEDETSLKDTSNSKSSKN